jgi:hypothetical protein
MSAAQLPETTNGFVDETLHDLHLMFRLQWQGATIRALEKCTAALARWGDAQKKCVFARCFLWWQEALLAHVESLFAQLVEIGLRYPECGVPDPATWADKHVRAMLQAQLVCADGRPIVDFFVTVVSLTEALRTRRAFNAARRRKSLPRWMDLHPRSEPATAPTSNGDAILDALREDFMQTLVLAVAGMVMGARTGLASRGWRPREICAQRGISAEQIAGQEVRAGENMPPVVAKSSESVPATSLAALASFAPRDKRLRDSIRVLYPALAGAIKNARSSLLSGKASVVSDVRTQFPLLQDATEHEIEVHILGPQAKGTGARTAAIEILRNRCPEHTTETIERYTRAPKKLSLCSSQSQN